MENMNNEIGNIIPSNLSMENLNIFLEDKNVCEMFNDFLGRHGCISQLKFVWAVNGLYSVDGATRIKLMKQIISQLLPGTHGIEQSTLTNLNYVLSQQNFNCGPELICSLTSLLESARDQAWVHIETLLFPQFRQENDPILCALSYAERNSGAFDNICQGPPSSRSTSLTFMQQIMMHKQKNMEIDKLARTNPHNFAYLLFQKLDQSLTTKEHVINQIPSDVLDAKYAYITRVRSNSSEDEEMDRILTDHVDNVLENSPSPILTSGPLLQDSVPYYTGNHLQQQNTGRRSTENNYAPSSSTSLREWNKRIHGSKRSLDSVISGTSMVSSSSHQKSTTSSSRVNRHPSLTSLDSGISSLQAKKTIWDKLREYNEMHQAIEEGVEEGAASLSSSSQSDDMSHSRELGIAPHNQSRTDLHSQKNHNQRKFKKNKTDINSADQSSLHTKYISTIVTFQSGNGTSDESFLLKIPTSSTIKLDLFKKYLPRKDEHAFRYFFKSEITCPEMGCGNEAGSVFVVNEEITEDEQDLPLVNGKIVAVVKTG